MNPVYCALVAMNLYSAPAGNTVVGVVQQGEPLQIQDVSTLRDFVFVGTPGWDSKGTYIGVRSRGWMQYINIGACQEGHLE